MQLTCPACGHAEARAHLAWRLEVCPRCRADGRQVYLTEGTEKPSSTPLRLGGRSEPRPQT